MITNLQCLFNIHKCICIPEGNWEEWRNRPWQWKMEPKHQRAKSVQGLAATPTLLSLQPCTHMNKRINQIRKSNHIHMNLSKKTQARENFWDIWLIRLSSESQFYFISKSGQNYFFKSWNSSLDINRITK